MTITVRQALFTGIRGCASHSCIVNDNGRIPCTNGPCTCLQNMSRTQLGVLSSRILTIADEDVRQNW